MINRSLRYFVPIVLAACLVAGSGCDEGELTHCSPEVTVDGANSFYPIHIVNYLGNIENIHPKVLYFDGGWRGHRYWMAYTPYPLGDVTVENPCVAVSDDGYHWTAPADRVNPLAEAPAGGYNSDTHLLYDPEEDRLEVWWRPVTTTGGTRDACVRSVSYDGVTWSAPQTVIPYGEVGECRLSPAVVMRDGRYYMVYSNCYQLLSMWGDRSRDGGILWETPHPLEVPVTERHLSYWHQDMIVDYDGTVEMVVCAFAPHEGGSNNAADLYYLTYDINNPATVSEPELIIGRSHGLAAIDTRSIYRSSIVRVDGEYLIYYSCINAEWHRVMTLSRGSDVRHLHGLGEVYLPRKQSSMGLKSKKPVR